MTMLFQELKIRNAMAFMYKIVQFPKGNCIKIVNGLLLIRDSKER